MENIKINYSGKSDWVWKRGFKLESDVYPNTKFIVVGENSCYVQTVVYKSKDKLLLGSIYQIAKISENLKSFKILK